MSPDSFFAGFEETPRRSTFGRIGDASGYASSETYDPPTQLPELTPASQRSQQAPSSEEFSYFMNYDLYMNTEDNDDEGCSDPPETLAIDLSPIEILESPQFPAPPRRRADTAIRAPLISRASCSGNASQAIFSHSTPTTPFQMTDGVPTWLVGAIG